MAGIRPHLNTGCLASSYPEGSPLSNDEDSSILEDHPSGPLLAVENAFTIQKKRFYTCVKLQVDTCVC